MGDDRTTAPRPVRVGAVDDHPVMLAGIRAELADSDPDLVLSRTAATVDELLADGDAYDVVLLDLRLGDGSRPLDNVSRLRAADADVVVYTDGLDNAAGREALSAGALGIVLKDEPSAALVEALLRVLDRGSLSARVPADVAAVLTLVVQSPRSTVTAAAAAVAAVAGPRALIDADHADLFVSLLPSS